MPFKFSFQVDDKNAVEVLKVIAGKVSDLDILPLSNAPVLPLASQKPAKQSDKSGTGIRNFCQELGLKAGFRFRPRELSLEPIGVSNESTGYVIRNEMAGGRIRKIDAGLYEVLP